MEIERIDCPEFNITGLTRQELRIINLALAGAYWAMSDTKKVADALEEKITEALGD